MKPCPECGGRGLHAEGCAVVKAIVSAPRSCTACGGSVYPIRLWTGVGHVPYSDFEAKRSWVHGGLAATGFVYAACCEGCHEVRLYAVPNQRDEADSLPLPAQQSTDPDANLPLPSRASSGNDSATPG